MIDETVKTLALGKNYATLTTLFPDGRPQTQVVWVDADDDHVLINTEVHRAKFKNVENDPRVAVAIIDSENPYHYVEARGRVVDTVRGEPARANIDALSRKYNGTDYQNPIQSERVILKIAVDQVHVQ